MAIFQEKGRWPLVRRLRWLRIGQYVLNVTIIAISAFLLAVLISNDAGLGGSVTLAMVVAALTLVLTFVQQCFGTRLAGYRRRGCLIFFILFDLLCLGLQVPLVAVLAAAGLPVDCHGIAFGRDPHVFGESGRGLTPTFCAVPNATFWLSIILMLSYIYTISLITRQIVAVSGELKLLRQEEKDVASQERITAIMAAHQAPPRTRNRARPSQVETVDLRTESVRGMGERDAGPPWCRRLQARRLRSLRLICLLGRQGI
ncbi:hypothetical protein J3458_020164 [Metarhizium acridum]|uniref:uncharacterized protein n=1 Tax=Metarhizium acridum TaxID=92637 RepID=UPI001C6A9E36|nr:hypothetical protein J3458_020164 [Metarhizium acridum]